MGNDRIRIVERAESDWKNLSGEEQSLVREVLDRLDDDPIAGVPLFAPLQGYWSYRKNWLRVVYRIMAEARIVIILKIARVADTSS